MSLQKIQERLKAPKSNFNSFGMYSYRNIEDIQTALKPLLAEYGYSLIISDDVIPVADRVYIKATARLFDEKNKLVCENAAFAREPADKKGMDASQITGATSSYARKYCLGGMFLLDDTKDADSMPHTEKQTELINPDQAETIRITMQQVEAKEAAFLKFFKVAKIEDLTTDQYGTAISMLESKRVKK